LPVIPASAGVAHTATNHKTVSKWANTWTQQIHLTDSNWYSNPENCDFSSSLTAQQTGLAHVRGLTLQMRISGGRGLRSGQVKGVGVYLTHPQFSLSLSLHLPYARLISIIAHARVTTKQSYQPKRSYTSFNTKVS
jgi:hypothetical protein